jgi:alcohol dehydrogenase class IV
MGKTAKYYQKNRQARLKRLRQQAEYNRTNKGKLLITRAQKLRRKLGIPKGSKMDAAHYKGSTSKGRPQHRSINRKSRTK